MLIRRAASEDRPALPAVWLRSVRASHAFLSESEIQALLPDVTSYLLSTESELWVVESRPGEPAGFMALSGSAIEAMFLSPEIFRRGCGRRLVELARERYGELTVDVNEQNEGACRFYASCGFVVANRK